MNNEFYEHKKSDAVKWIIVFVLIAVLIAGVVASLAVSLSDKIDTEEPETETETAAYANDFTAECFNSPNVKLAMSSAATVAADSSVSKTLTATVYPLDATNRLVDWSIAWSNQGKSEDVTDYVTVTPTYDGSSEATVTCLKPFGSDQITITVTTRQGGYTATCVVTFRGVATSIYLTSSVSPTTNSGRENTTIFPAKPPRPLPSI